MIRSNALDDLLGRATRVQPGPAFIRHPGQHADDGPRRHGALCYDFDILAAASGEAVEARFRSAATLEVLMRADPAAGMLLQDCGFVLHSYDSGVPPGHYLYEQTAQRQALVHRLRVALAEPRAKDIRWGLIDPRQFLRAIDAARPLIDSSLIAYPVALRRAETARRLALQKQRGIRRLAAIGLVSGIALLAIALGSSGMISPAASATLPSALDPDMFGAAHAEAIDRGGVNLAQPPH